QAILQPEARNTSAASCAVSKPSLVTASIPAAAKKFTAKAEVSAKPFGGPRLARNIFGRSPVLLKCSSAAARKISYGSASRREGRAAPVRTGASLAPAGAGSRRLTGPSARRGNAL